MESVLKLGAGNVLDAFPAIVPLLDVTCIPVPLRRYGLPPGMPALNLSIDRCAPTMEALDIYN